MRRREGERMTRYVVEFRANRGEGDKAMGLFRQMEEYF